MPLWHGRPFAYLRSRLKQQDIGYQRLGLLLRGGPAGAEADHLAAIGEGLPGFPNILGLKAGQLARRQDGELLVGIGIIA